VAAALLALQEEYGRGNVSAWALALAHGLKIQAKAREQAAQAAMKDG
jgi:hypothetical protein